MKHTIKKIYIKNKYRTLYQKGNNYYYRYENKYYKITNKQLKFIGGVGESSAAGAPGADGATDADGAAGAPGADGATDADGASGASGEAAKEEEKRIMIRTFVDEKRLIKYKISLFEEIIKYYKRIFDNDIIDSIKKSLKFLTKYNNRIDVLIDTYKHDDEGELNSTQIRMLITNMKKFIFEKIFVNYFIDIISKYYDVSDMRVEIEELMHMLTFVEDDRREELLYSQKINILLDRLSDYSSKFRTDYSSKLNKFDETYQLLKENKNEDGEEEEKDKGEYDDMSLANFLKVKQGILKEFKESLEVKETKFVEMQQTIYWWNKLGPTLESEFKVKNKSYIKSLEIFFNELIRETIYNDLAIEELKNKKQPEGDDKMDPALYNIYVDFLRNDFLGTLKKSEEESEKKIEEESKEESKKKSEKNIKFEFNEKTINGNVSYEEYKKLKKAGMTSDKIKIKYKINKEDYIDLGIKGRFKESIDEYMDKEIETLEKELNDLLKTKQKLLIPGMITGGDEESISEKRDNITNTKSKFQKMRKILIDKMLKYTDILLILAKAKNDFKDDKDNEVSKMVTKQSFRDMAKILILFLKQHILNFSELFRKILNDIKRYHEIIMQEVDLCDKLLREAENE